MGFLELTDVAYRLPGGWTLFEGVGLPGPRGSPHSALVGANGIGKTTLLRLIAGEEEPARGLDPGRRPRRSDAPVHRVGRATDDGPGVPARLQRAGGAGGGGAPRAGRGAPGRRPGRAGAARLRRRRSRRGRPPAAIARRCCGTAARRGVRRRVPGVGDRPIETLSGGERKRSGAGDRVPLARSTSCVLDEPDNTLDIEGKEWLEVADHREDPRTILFVSHDRTVLERAATHIVTLEGRATWTHPGGFATYAAARDARVDRLDEQHRRYEEERKRLDDMIKEMKRKAAYNDGWASKARAAEHRLERFEDREQPPEKAEVQDVRMRVDGGRTGKVAFRARGLAIAGHRRSVRRRGPLRRADRRDRSQRHRQVALPAAARGRGDRARRRVDARRARRARAVRAAARAARHRRPPDPRGLA